MWIMTSFGVLMPSVRPEGTVPAGDNRLIQVRARRAQDLRILKAEYLPELGEIIEIPYSDYEYRAYCTHEQWAAALAAMAMDIDYTKFKPTTETKYRDPQLHALYNRIWSLFFGFVSTKEHQARYWHGPAGDRINRFKRGSKRGTVKAADFDWGQYEPTTGSPRFSDLVGTVVDPEADAIAAVPVEWDDEIPVTRRPDGTIDHSECDHGQGRNAKRRCQRRNTKRR